ncbi:hypothetical protein [Silvibacterium dinghuense]|uniref:DUF2029 domain-containing protein n=1 Tax=Silvibacterium dinghuense TaxID=1560006 RepID=A0A4Q1SGP5_9BACT|nr:hypothetical protein [Silvibacterium dinghuense]RXS96684.1 hypothetical protein ESZ00_01685 [Silvibacterium dinghuense]GGG92851.1 hypothetical protein GCM10011586_04430 [Silvibacterium dinghuense]
MSASHRTHAADGGPDPFIPKLPPALFLFLATLAVLGVYVWLNPSGARYFWDAKVYARAVTDWQAHRDPYTDGEGLLFVYPPLVLAAATALSHLLPGVIGWTVFFTLHFASVLVIPWLFARFYFQRPWLSLPFAFLIYAAEPSYASVVALRGGNIASVVYAAAFAAAVPGIRSNRWGWFYTVVFLCGLIKPPFLLLLLFPVLAGHWWKSIACGLLSASSYPLQQWLAPDLYRRFVIAARIQVADHSDFGSGILGAVATIERKLFHHPVNWFPYLVQGIVLAVIVFLLFRARRHAVNSEALWLGCLTVAVILANPRLLRYDTCISLFAAFFVLVEALRIRRPLLLLGVIYFPSLLSLYVRLKSHRVDAWGTWETIVMVAALLVGLWRLWQLSQAEVPESGRLAASSQA